MLNMKTISVIIPTYNSAAYLPITVRSALAQKHDGLQIEVIVIDDGSTDDISSALSNLPEEVIQIRKPNGGVSSARNLGFTRASGQFICFLDADDILADGWFKEVFDHFDSNPEFGAVYGGFRRWHASVDKDPAAEWELARLEEHGKRDGRLVAGKSGWIYDRMLLDSWILCSSAVVRADVAKRAGLFVEGIPAGEDWDFWIRVSRISPVAAINRTAVLYRQHPQSASRKLRERNYAADLIIHSIQTYGWANPNGSAADRQKVYAVIAKHCIWHAVDHFDRGEYKVGLRSSARALRYQPTNARAWRLLLLGATGLARLYGHWSRWRARHGGMGL